MKKLTILTVCFLWAVTGFAQSEKYQAKMKELVPYFDSINPAERLVELAGTFERIGDAEKNQWLPYYYSALSHVFLTYKKIQGQTSGTAAIIDPATEKAEAVLAKALALTKENSETLCVTKMIASLRMMADPMNRWQEYGAAATEALSKAKEMDANNPRVYLLEAQDKFFTPEQYGGSKTEAKTLFEKSLALYGKHTPETPLHPVWGKMQIGYYLSQIK
jgi:hypothetical protein